ncbi:helix-turn-helix domain-containing protein [uncultured Fibrella sp.]|uniref:helix-turn-helix domain-containing protein n=1 Tax=uncultured Fibrella sp. TaxID=1284596 RepID=UPI0035CBEC8E
MQSYRKYVDSAQLQALLNETPSWGVDILTIGHNVHQPRMSYPDPNHPNQYQFDWQAGRRLDEYQLVYIANGQGVFESEGVAPSLVEGGTAFLLHPGVWHRFKPSEATGWEEFWVGFRGHYAEYLMQQPCFDARQPLMRIRFRSELLTVFTRLIDTLKYQGLAYQQLATCQVIQLLGLVYASALTGDTSRSRREQIVHQVRYRIQGSWTEAIDFEALSAELTVSYVWFRKAFKEVMGLSPGQYHLNLKLEKAGQLLQETTLSVSEIAYQTGFDSLFHFSRMFRKKKHLSPSDFRKQAQHNVPALTKPGQD